MKNVEKEQHRDMLPSIMLVAGIKELKHSITRRLGVVA
jgi:hypothetical protein